MWHLASIGKFSKWISHRYGLACGATTYDDELSEGEDGWSDPDKGVDDGAKPGQR